MPARSRPAQSATAACSSPSAALDREVAVGRAVVAVEAGGVDPGGGEVGGEVVAGAVAADGREQRDRAAQRRQGARDVQRDAAGLADHAAGHVGAGRQRRGGAADDVPVRGADAEERRTAGLKAGRRGA